jgi:biopolymer transport protein ExbD
MITRPLDLQSRLSPAPRSLDGLFWVNGVIVVLFFTLLGSKFVLPPGVATDFSGGNMLPQAGSLTGGVTGPTVVVSYRSDNVILFEDGIYSFVQLRGQMERYITVHPGSVVLLRINADASVGAFMKIGEMAKALGYAGVVLATENQTREKPDEITPLR